MSETITAEALASLQRAIETLMRHGRTTEAKLVTRVFVDMTRQAHRRRKRKAEREWQIPF